MAAGRREAWLRNVAAAVAATMMMVLAGTGRADEGILVQGSGSAKARPTQVEIECALSGDAELASDATVKFRDAKKRALAAIEAMKNKDVAVISDGLSINNTVDAQTQAQVMRGNGGTPGKPRVQIMEKDHIVLSNADKLEPDVLLETILKILDVAKDAGFQVGIAPPTNYYETQMSNMIGNALVTFKVPDGSGLRDQAYKAALEDAKAKAHKLAELSGVKLGRVISIQETAAQGSKSDLSGLPSYMIMAMMGMESKMAGGDEKSIISTTAGDLTKHLQLTVEFEIAK